MPALRDQADAALATAHRTGWDGLVAEQRAYLDDVWERADIEVVGDERLQQAMRFAVMDFFDWTDAARSMVRKRLKWSLKREVD